MAETDVEHEKRLAAEAAARLVERGMTVGLGTGSTVAYLLPALAARGVGEMKVRCVATSPATAAAATRLGLDVEPFDRINRLDLAIDGADQVSPEGWLVKGGGGAHTREKIVAAAAARFVVIVSSNKLVDRLQPPVPLEIVAFGVAATLRRLPEATLRAGTPLSPEGGLIADWHGAVDDPDELSATLAAAPGVVEHGLFPPALVADIIVGRSDRIEHRSPWGRGGNRSASS
jgi:ribose 5-phosphate isomerase A